MARKYSSGASKKVEKAMHERKEGTLKSGRSGKTVKSRKQAIAIGRSPEGGQESPEEGVEQIAGRFPFHSLVESHHDGLVQEAQRIAQIADLPGYNLFAIRSSLS